MGGTRTKTSKAGENGSSTAASLIGAAGEKLISVLISAGSLLGFVAFAGGVILWTRFHAIGVPPEQAVDAIPDGELIATGSVLLLLFGFFGALALVCAFLIDRSARLTPGMALFLLILFALEGTVAIVLVEGHSLKRTVVDLLFFLPPVAGAAWVTRLDWFSTVKDDLRARPREKLPPRLKGGFLRPDRRLKQQSEEGATRWALAPLAIVGLSVLAAGGLYVFDAGDTVSVVVLGGLSGLLVLAIALLAGLDRHANEADDVRRKNKKREKKAKKKLRREAEEAREYARKNCEPPPARPIKSRMYRHRPRRFVLKTGGELAAYILLALAVILPAIRLDKTWLLVALVAAALITVGVRRVAWLANERLMWFGIALFLSVPLFGTVMTMARNLTEPKVQPVAIIRSTDGPDEAIQGLYVTETDDRVYFANVATEGCGETFKRNSSRLLWVPKNDVVAMSIGPAQDVEGAGRTAQEMANALTPGIETPTGENVTLKVPGDGIDSSADGAVEGGSKDGSARLVDPGPAVRPEFGRRLELKPEVAAPNETVTLIRPKLKPEQEGFGENSEGKKRLRLNGMEVKVEEWTKEKIEFTVPKNATSGEVTIGCEPLAGQPFLTVSRKPKARISVIAKPGSNRVVLDGRRSYDDGEIKKFEWRVSGLDQREPQARIVHALPPRTGFYRVRLTVTDDEGETDTKLVRILRLRAPHFEFDREVPESKRMITHLLKAFSRDVAKDRREASKKAMKHGGEWKDDIEPPVAIEIAGHADDAGTFTYNARLSWRRALGVWRALYRREAGNDVGQAWIESPKQKPKLTIRGFGETCPLDPGGGRLRENRRVEIFVLDDGARVIFPRKCHAVYVKHAAWGDAPP